MPTLPRSRSERFCRFARPHALEHYEPLVVVAQSASVLLLVDPVR